MWVNPGTAKRPDMGQVVHTLTEAIELEVGESFDDITEAREQEIFRMAIPRTDPHTDVTTVAASVNDEAEDSDLNVPAVDPTRLLLNRNVSKVSSFDIEGR